MDQDLQRVIVKDPRLAAQLQDESESLSPRVHSSQEEQESRFASLLKLPLPKSKPDLKHIDPSKAVFENYQ